jgi:hypothetical protein
MRRPAIELAGDFTLSHGNEESTQPFDIRINFYPKHFNKGYGKGRKEMVEPQVLEQFSQ